MDEEKKAKLTPEERAVTVERIRDVLRVAVVDGENGPVLDLDTLTRLLLKLGIEYRMLNREVSFMELQMIRTEQNTQKVRADNRHLELVHQEEAQLRLRALRDRERVILEQLWPIQ